MSENSDKSSRDKSDMGRNSVNKVSDIDLIQALVSSLENMFKQQIKTLVWFYIGSLCGIVLISFLCLSVRGCDFQIVGKCPCCVEAEKTPQNDREGLKNKNLSVNRIKNGHTPAPL